MRPYIFLLLIVSLAGCADKKNTDIFVRPIDSAVKPGQVSAKPNSTDLFFSDDLWNHITSNFQSASIELFRISNLSFPNLVSDTAYSFAMINETNRSNLLKYLPKDLTLAESSNYTEEMTMKMPNAPDAVNDSLKRKWTKAVPGVEAEYIKFHSLLTSKKDYIIIMRNSYLKHLLQNIASF